MKYTTVRAGKSGTASTGESAGAAGAAVVGAAVVGAAVVGAAVVGAAVVGAAVVGAAVVGAAVVGAAVVGAAVVGAAVVGATVVGAVCSRVEAGAGGVDPPEGRTRSNPHPDISNSGTRRNRGRKPIPVRTLISVTLPSGCRTLMVHTAMERRSTPSLSSEIPAWSEVFAV